MRIALFSDIHGHITGLQAVFARLKQIGGAEVIFALGDHIGGGPGLNDVIDLLLEAQVRMIRGNWDELFMDYDQHLAKIAPTHRDAYLQTAEWMLTGMTSAYQKLLAELPVSEALELSPKYKLLVCHATPADTNARVCKADVATALLREAYGQYDAQVIAYGHYHSQHILHLDDKLLVNVASVGLGWQGLSSLTILDATKDDLRIQQYQVPYDIDVHNRLVNERKMPNAQAIWYW